MLIASLIESRIPKMRMWQKHNIQLANLDLASLRVIWFELGPLLGCRHSEMWIRLSPGTVYLTCLSLTIIGNARNSLIFD